MSALPLGAAWAPLPLPLRPPRFLHSRIGGFWQWLISGRSLCGHEW